MTAAARFHELARPAAGLVSDFFAVRPGEEVLITADTASDTDVVRAVFGAVQTSGGRPTVVMTERLPFQGRLADPFISAPLFAAVQKADVWIDLTFPYLAGSHAHDEAMKTGRVRALLGGDMTAAGFARLFAGSDIGAVLALRAGFVEYLRTAVGKPCRITSPGGTDVTFRIAETPAGAALPSTAPGTYAPPGSVIIPPDPDSVAGRIVVETVFHEYYTVCRAPLTVTVNGAISEIDGDPIDIRVMDRALRRAGGGDYGKVIHFTYGFHPEARFTGRSFIEDIRVTGANAIGFGLPWWVPGGGENHPDAVVTNQSLWIGDDMLAEQGRLIGPAHLLELQRGMAPAQRGT